MCRLMTGVLTAFGDLALLKLARRREDPSTVSWLLLLTQVWKSLPTCSHSCSLLHSYTCSPLLTLAHSCSLLHSPFLTLAHSSDKLVPPLLRLAHPVHQLGDLAPPHRPLLLSSTTRPWSRSSQCDDEADCSPRLASLGASLLHRHTPISALQEVAHPAPCPSCCSAPGCDGRLPLLWLPHLHPVELLQSQRGGRS